MALSPSVGLNESLEKDTDNDTLSKLYFLQ